MAECDFRGCEKPVRGPRGLCMAHDAQLRRGWELRPLLVRVPWDGPCLAGGCDNARRALGYCAMHYQQIKRGERPRPKAERFPCTISWCKETKGRRARACTTHSARLRQFNLTADELNAIFERQNASCAVCGSGSSGWSDWHIDHDHACCDAQVSSCGNCVRGLLCGRCNIMLGHAKDDPELLSSAIAYLGVSSGDQVGSTENVVRMKVGQHGNADHQEASV